MNNNYKVLIHRFPDEKIDLYGGLKRRFKEGLYFI